MSLLDAFDFEMVTASLVGGGTDGSYDDEGAYSPGATETPVDIFIVKPQPVTANELQMLPSGERTMDYLKSYLKTTINTRELLVDSDIISYSGRNYKVIQVEDRSQDGGFYKFYLKRSDNE